MHLCKECEKPINEGEYCKSCYVYFYLSDLEEEREASRKSLVKDGKVLLEPIYEE